MPKIVSDDEIARFYEQHGNELLLREPIFKGRVIVLPQQRADGNNLQKMLKATGSEDIASLHHYALANSYKYIVSDEDYVPVSELKRMLQGMPDINWSKPPSSIVSWQHDGMEALLLIKDSRAQGQAAPMEYVKNEIRNLIIDQRKTDFIQDFEQKLLEKAIADGDLVRH